MFDKIAIALSSQVKQRLTDDPGYCDNLMFQSALLVPVDFVRVGLCELLNFSGQSRFRPIIESTSAQGVEFRKLFRECDRITAYLHYKKGETWRLFVKLTVWFSHPKQPSLVYLYEINENGRANERH